MPDELQRVYGQAEYSRGRGPNALAETALEFAPDREAPAAVDLGANEGRDAVHLAEKGYGVLVVDVAPNGLEKAEHLADERGVTIQTRQADVNDLQFAAVDVVYSYGALQYLRPENRDRQFERFKADTTHGGIHVMFAFVNHGENSAATDWGDDEHLYERGELRSYYDDWEILLEDELVFENAAAGPRRPRIVETLVARNPEVMA